MLYIKYNTQAEAQAVQDRVFNDANNDGRFVNGTTAYARIEQETYFTLPILEGFEMYFTPTEIYGAHQFAEEKQGRLVVDDLLKVLKDANLSTNDMATILNYVLSVIVICLAGHLRAAKVIANNLNTTALYTASRKTWLLNRLQTEIDKL